MLSDDYRAAAMEIRAIDGNSRSSRPEERIASLTLVLGSAAAVIVAWRNNWRSGAGVFIGALLAWINFRWLQGALDALEGISTAQPGEGTPRIPFSTYARFFARYLLIGLVLYGMVTRFGVPVLSLLGGLCALGAAAMAGSLYEIFAPRE